MRNFSKFCEIYCRIFLKFNPPPTPLPLPLPFPPPLEENDFDFGTNSQIIKQNQNRKWTKSKKKILMELFFTSNDEL